MKRSLERLAWFAFGLIASVVVPPIQGQVVNPDQDKQNALEASTPKLQVKEEVLPLVVPGHTIGETEGVSKNSKDHLFVYTRTGYGGIARGATAAQLYEFDQNLRFVKIWGPENYAASFAHSVIGASGSRLKLRTGR